MRLPPLPSLPSLPPLRFPHRSLVVAACLAAGAVACSSGESKPVQKGAGNGDSAGGTVDRSVGPLPQGFVLPPVVTAGARPYAAAAVAGGGSVTGVVEAAGDVPADSTIRPTVDDRACGASLLDRTIARRGNRIGGVVVWLADLRSGKPFPLTRRFELDMDKCLLTPRAQAALAGGTLNVKSSDPVRSRLHFIRRPANEVVSTVTMNDAGQVVPDEKILAAPGVVEVRGEVHPWLRAWVLVFDHPYHAATGADGGFSLADVPPGSYRLVAWHERLGVAEQAVTVEGGKATTVTLRFGGGAPAPTVAGDSAARRDTTSPPAKGGR